LNPDGDFQSLSLAELAKLEMAQLARERETTDPDPELWRWSPLELQEFARMLVVARSAAMDGLRRLIFMEAGSGIGTKLYVAQYHFDMTAIGYEINPDYIYQAQKLNVLTHQMDFRTEVPPWGDADIVYMARPFKSDEADTVAPDAVEIAWELGVMEMMRPGAVLMSAFAAVKPRDWACYYRRPFRGVWVKPGGRSTPVYDAMVSRATAGSDPLVPEPLSRPGR
jgi:hypothetical protein